jgi:hypothetical protein
VRRGPPRQNCAKISGCIGSGIPTGERGPRPMRETCVRSRSRLRRQLSCCSPGLLSGRLMPRQGLARSVLPERLRITLRSILWPAASMRFAGRATPWCAGCSTAGAPVVAVFIAETQGPACAPRHKSHVRPPLEAASFEQTQVAKNEAAPLSLPQSASNSIGPIRTRFKCRRTSSLCLHAHGTSSAHSDPSASCPREW